MKILFICVYNSARSQIAEGLARHLGQGKIEVFSAGLQATGVNPYAVEVMREIDIDISDQRSKSAQEYTDEEFDYVVTLCSEAEGKCPVFPGDGVVLHWPMQDPNQAGNTRDEKLAAFRQIRDEISQRIVKLLKESL